MRQTYINVVMHAGTLKSFGSKRLKCDCDEQALFLHKNVVTVKQHRINAWVARRMEYTWSLDKQTTATYKDNITFNLTSANIPTVQCKEWQMPWGQKELESVKAVLNNNTLRLCLNARYGKHQTTSEFWPARIQRATHKYKIVIQQTDCTIFNYVNHCTGYRKYVDIAVTIITLIAI